MDKPENTAEGEQSIFDSGDGPPNFWKQTDMSDFGNYPTIAECEFYTYNKKVFFEWESCSLSIRGNFLVYSKVN